MIKRTFDILVSLAALLLLWPVLLVLAVLVRVKLGPPALFRQQRPGLHGRPFTMLKFRTMTDARDAEGNLLPDGERLSSFGRSLRSTSLDELPELINVVAGDMSLVGPRPLLMRYLDRYTPEQMRRHEVRPGITGWAQVNQGHVTELEDIDAKLQYDFYYIKNFSYWLDFLILMRTAQVVLTGHGAK